MDCTPPPQDRVMWSALVNTAMVTSSSMKGCDFIDQLSDYYFSARTLLRLFG
jgi:hypothetical protein